MAANLKGEQKARYVQNMFGRIAKRYNFMNRLMTFGQDQRWRRFVVQQAQLPEGGALLDLATGTGDIAFEAIKKSSGVTVVGADFSLPMMFVGQQRPLGHQVKWCGADAMQLPFSSKTFDAVTSGYLLRNVIDIERTLKEQLRVLKPGGCIVVLDSSPPRRNILRPFIRLHLKYGIPLLGRLIVGKDAADAYRYLPESTQAFKTPEELASLMRQAGIENVSFQMFMFGTIAIHRGEKPSA